jgi:hypothetical protein
VTPAPEPEPGTAIGAAGAQAMTASVAGEVEIGIEVDIDLGGAGTSSCLGPGWQHRHGIQVDLIALQGDEVRPELELADDPLALSGIEGAGGAFQGAGALGLFTREPGSARLGGEGLEAVRGIPDRARAVFQSGAVDAAGDAVDLGESHTPSLS